ncbi:hypothetical protein BXP70_19585 [Hymenobacter crusticola]|uniref:DUF2157 domain-containing protein n=2 Tax=Hymenobacter crusticola TaxID=1770526 RepID=A0A243WA56_9BACT|nr:hypothetical protein BXP70_19585 [Hymenobacter crusticola]
MLSDQLLADLQARGLLPPAQANAIGDYERARPFSLHYELRTLLYLGIVLLSGGLGVLLYQHLDDLSHSVIVAGISLLMTACFAYAVQQRTPFTWGHPQPAGLLPDYALLLGCLLFLTLEGYLQAQYQFFGTRYGLALALPAVLFFGLAYRFDHRGVLSMAITALASWMGVAVAPVAAITQHYTADPRLTGAAVELGLLLVAAGLWSEFQNRKRHFAFTYLSLGSNLALIAATAALFSYSSAPAWLPAPVAVVVILLLSAFLIWYARRTYSYVFLLLGVLYGYTVVTYLVFELIDRLHTNSSFGSALSEFVFMVYIMSTTVGIVAFFVNIKKFLRPS